MYILIPMPCVKLTASLLGLHGNENSGDKYYFIVFALQINGIVVCTVVANVCVYSNFVIDIN